MGLKITLKRIAEDTYATNDQILADASKPLAPKFGIELMSDIKKNLLTVKSEIAYVTPEKEIAVGLRFLYTLEVDSLKSLEYITNPQKGTHDYKFPDGFLEMVLTDVYATGRVLMAQKLIGTRLEGQFLPFGGAEHLFGLLKR